MRVDLRVKHDIEARKAAIGLFELGHGYKSAAIALSLPVEAVRRWQEIYRAFGSEVLLRMDGKQGRYTYEQKVAAASAVVDGGMTKTEAMAAFGIMSMSPLKKWCALYRRGGAEALRPRPKGRPKGSKARPRTREEELEERCRRLEAEVAYLKKLRALVARAGLGPGRRPQRARPGAPRGTRSGTGSHAPRSSGRPTTTPSRTRRGPRAPSSGRRPPRSSRAPPTAAGTGR